MSNIPSADTRAVVRAVAALTTQVGRIADTLTTPVVEHADAEETTPVRCPLCPVAVPLANPQQATDHFRAQHPEQRLNTSGPWPLLVSDDGPTTPATTCSAQYTGVLPVGDCIRPAGHTPDTDRTEDRGRNWGNASAEYPTDSPPTVSHWRPISEQQAKEQQELASMVSEFIDAQQRQARAAAEEACLTHIAGACDGTTRDCVHRPAADEEQTLRWTRRESLLVLLTRLQRGRTLTEDEAGTLRHHVETEIREADTARAVAAGNKRHVQTIVPDIDRLARQNEQLHAARATWKAKAEEMERDRDKYARSEAEEQARADQAERELRTLRTGLRAAGGDPTQIQNLWAQLRLRNRQWAEAKREVKVTRGMLEEEGGDVRLVDEMLATVANAEKEAREARQERDANAVDLEAADRIRAEAQRDRDQHAAVLGEVLAAFVHKVEGYRIPRRSAEADVATLEKWRSVVAPTVEQPWWQQVAMYEKEAVEATKHVLELKAAIERVRAVKKSPPRSEHNARANAQDEGWDQALDAVHAALDGPTETNT